MTYWILFIWMSGSVPIVDAMATKAECLELAAPYKYAKCIPVKADKPRQPQRGSP